MDCYTITTINLKKIEKGLGTEKSPDKKFTTPDGRVIHERMIA
jgi:hypothetical protein